MTATIRIFDTTTGRYIPALFSTVDQAETEMGQICCRQDECASIYEIDDVPAGMTKRFDVTVVDSDGAVEYSARTRPMTRAPRFYVIESNYVGPDMGRRREHTAWIALSPGSTNQSGAERTEGWLGTTNDIVRTACGEFETIEAARTRVEYLLDVPAADAVADDHVAESLDALEAYVVAKAAA
jgi:hypothetical protein